MPEIPTTAILDSVTRMRSLADPGGGSPHRQCSLSVLDRPCYPQKALAWLDRLLAHADERVPALVRANAICYATLLAGFRRQVAEQMRDGRKAAALTESLGEDATSHSRMCSSGRRLRPARGR
jgi:hypothetical protein